jgi:protocatechuate 3,4-dioxygenase beta subunit
MQPRRYPRLGAFFALILFALCACSQAPAADPTATDSTLNPPQSTQPALSPATPEAVQTQAPERPTQSPAQPSDIPSATADQSCQPTQPDQEGPFYKAGAPIRDHVGEGYVLQGVVRSATGCAPIAGAQIEFWMAGPDGQYTDDYRATMLVGEDGAYRFESNFPPPYSGRPPHIHLRVSAEGYQTLITQHYPKEGENGASLDLVLVPEQ